MDRDNPQETGMHAWLAGIIDGEGTISLIVSERTGRRQLLKVHPKVIIANTDQGIIDRCFEALDVIGVGRYQRTDRNQRQSKLFELNGYVTQNTYKPVTIIEIQGFKRVTKLLKAVGPWLAGEKKERARLLMAFIEGRTNRCEAAGKAMNMMYCQEDVDNAMAFLMLTKSKRLDHVSRILNEHMRDASATT